MHLPFNWQSFLSFLQQYWNQVSWLDQYCPGLRPRRWRYLSHSQFQWLLLADAMNIYSYFLDLYKGLYFRKKSDLFYLKKKDWNNPLISATMLILCLEKQYYTDKKNQKFIQQASATCEKASPSMCTLGYGQEKYVSLNNLHEIEKEIHQVHFD